MNAPYPTCTQFYAGIDPKYQSQAIAICSNIVKNANAAIVGGGQSLFYSGTNPVLFDPVKYYSIMVPLNDGNWYCSGSSGVSAEYPGYGGANSAPNDAGCWGNP